MRKLTHVRLGIGDKEPRWDQKVGMDRKEEVLASEGGSMEGRMVEGRESDSTVPDKLHHNTGMLFMARGNPLLLLAYSTF